MERRNISVPKAHGGEAVARIVHDGLNVPHSTAKGLIDAGCVTINGRPARSYGQRCDGGDVVEVRYDPARKYEPHPPPRHGPGFRVVHEDLEIVVVDKTPGLLSSPAPGRRDESLAELIAESLRSRGIKKPQLFVVHRLDQYTSGLLVFARTPRAMEWLAAQFESREAGRAYTAIVQGRIERDRGTIQSWLVEDAKSLSVHTTSTRGAGKRALTHFAVQERFEDATLARVGLETGRKHQIRVHLAEIGHPVLGDRRYGDPSSTLQRVALHAERLTFRHPRTLETLTFDAPWPDDLKKLVLSLRRGTAPRPEGEGEADGREAVPKAGSPFNHDRARASQIQAMQGHGAVSRGAGRSGFEARRVAVFPRGLTLTDPIGPVSAWLQGAAQNLSPAVVAGRPPRAGFDGAPGMAALRGAAERARAPSDAAYARPSGDRRPDHGARGPDRRPPQDDRRAASAHAQSSARAPAPPDARRPADKVWRNDVSPDRRERLLRERSVGNRPGTRRPRPRDPEAPPTTQPPWMRERERGEGHAGPRGGSRAFDGRTGSDRLRPPGGARTFEKKPWQQKRGAKPRMDETRKPWQRGGAGPAREEAPGAGRGAPGRPRTASDAKPWAAKSAGKPWAGKDAAKPRAGNDAVKPWAAKIGAKPWAGKTAGKPWAAKSPGKPWAGKTGTAKPDGKSWRDRPREAKPGDGPPWKAKPRDASLHGGKARGAKPWDSKPQGRSVDPGSKPAGKKPWTGKPRDKKPWEFKQKGMTLRRERRRKIAAAQAKGRKGRKP